MGHLVQPSSRSRVTYSRLHRNLSRQILNISREGDSTTSLGSLFQCSVTLRGKKFFLLFRRNFLCLSLCPLPLVLQGLPTSRKLPPSQLDPVQPLPLIPYNVIPAQILRYSVYLHPPQPPPSPSLGGSLVHRMAAPPFQNKMAAPVGEGPSGPDVLPAKPETVAAPSNQSQQST